jgi:hypothetical protein
LKKNLVAGRRKSKKCDANTRFLTKQFGWARVLQNTSRGLTWDSRFQGDLTSVVKSDSFLYFKRSLDSSHILFCHNTRFTLFPTAAAGPTSVKVHVSSSFSHVSVVFMTLAWLRKEIPNTSPKRSEWTRNHQNTVHAGMDINTSRKE